MVSAAILVSRSNSSITWDEVCRRLNLALIKGIELPWVLLFLGEDQSDSVWTVTMVSAK
jgi:hypothetical protein